jgi:hypothetical protein
LRTNCVENFNFRCILEDDNANTNNCTYYWRCWSLTVEGNTTFFLSFYLSFLSFFLSFLSFSWLDSHSGPRPPDYWDFEIILRHTILGRTPLGEWPARRRELCLTTHRTYKTHTCMTPAGFEPAIPTSEKPQIHALDRAATGIGWGKYMDSFNRGFCKVRGRSVTFKPHVKNMKLNACFCVHT